MNLNTVNCVLVVFIYLTIIYLNPVLGQQVVWVQDTIFNNHLSEDPIRKQGYHILYNQDTSIAIDKDGIRSFPKIENVTKGIISGDVYLVQVDGKSYFVQNLELKPDKGLNLSLSNLSYSGQHSAISDSAFIYILNDSLFVDNVTYSNKTFVSSGSIALLNNNSYLELRNEQSEEKCIYNLHTKNKFCIPKNFHTLDTENEYLVIAKGLGEDYNSTIQVYNLKGEILLTQNEKYERYSISKDLVILHGENLKSKAFYKGKLITIPEDIVWSSSISNSDLIIVKNSKGKRGLINAQGKLIYDIKYKTIGETDRNSLILLQLESGVCTLINLKGEIVIEGKYNSIEPLFEDRFLAYNGYKGSIINKAGKVLKSNILNSNYSFTISKTNGVKLFITIDSKERRIYDYNLDKIAVLPNTRNSHPYHHEFSFLGEMRESLSLLNEEQALKINKTNVWVIRSKIEGKNVSRFEKLNGVPLSGWFSGIFDTDQENLYIVKTQNEKYGVVQIMK